MPYLEKKWFKEKEGIFPDLAQKLSAASFDIGVTQTLVTLGWDGRPIAAVGLALSPDNRRIARSQFLLQGVPSKDPITLQASKLFPAADPAIKMSIKLPDSAEFRFNGGSLSSDLLHCDAFTHHFSKGESIIFPTDWTANKLGETCMRAVCHLDKASNTSAGPKPKVTILLFPRSAEEMNQLTDSTQNPAWPGIRILQYTAEFFPKFNAWQDPICPLLMMGGFFHDAPNLPHLDDIRFHIAALMRSARLPTACTTGNGLIKQWAKALADVETLEREPSVVWPPVSRPTAPEGNHNYMCTS